MSKMQNVKFHSIDDFLEYLPDQERVIVDKLREIILECMPHVREKLSYNVPYYFGYRRICFIWPAAVPWGKVPMDGVQLGFCQGNLLHDDIGYLEKGNRKQVSVKVFHSLNDIDENLLRAFLFEAVEVDEQLKRDNKK